MKYTGILILIFLVGCNSAIKNEKAKVVIEEGAKTVISEDSQTNNQNLNTTTANESFENSNNEYWVGFFNPHSEINLQDKTISADDGLYWGRSNKISISIDKIIGDSLIGHSVVAGNHRPFYGRSFIKDNVKEYIVKEPGDDQYDGQFTFKITNNKLIGVWEAYKKIDIPKREYGLSKKTFKYDPNINLSRRGRYGDWNKFIDHGAQYEVFDKGTPDEEIYEWIKREYASSTEKIYEINASNTLLTKEVIENLTNSDLVVIRNTIYARHGYSFKNRPLRVFFDEQDWYIPVHADIKQEFTEIEKKNIQLLLKYEKNAKEYYDYFGRG
ncbi:YARHG domain-containing protein [Allomuricauda sp. XS_ASV26]|uniref:YARHG domain-containing protein n=1 Tax=Allomuricauda sp. XS_ASV26 TaxID=3241292 RepID=UPI0035119121